MSTLVNKIGPVLMAAVAIAMVTMAGIAQAKEAPSSDSAVLAIVNGDKILKDDALNALKSMNVPAADTDKVLPVVVDQMINEKLINSEVAKAQIEKDPAFQARLALAKAQLVRTAYLEKYLKDKITDQAVKSEYEKLKKENKGKEEVHARHILVATEEEAKQIIKDLDAGARFETLAKERSSGPTAKNGGDVGYFAQGEIVPEFSNAAFQLKAGTYTKTPIKTQFGWHVIYVEDRRTRVVPDLKDVETSIRNKLGQEAVEKLVTGLRAKADIKRFGMDGKPVEEATKKN
ncbi:MAG: peptidylprolyl isomerase [Proteobacteria bacterium]|nr:peptidylprolyl isomerase [Pseudomonadota bacterium]